MLLGRLPGRLPPALGSAAWLSPPPARSSVRSSRLRGTGEEVTLRYPRSAGQGRRVMVAVRVCGEGAHGRLARGSEVHQALTAGEPVLCGGVEEQEVGRGCGRQ